MKLSEYFSKYQLTKDYNVNLLIATLQSIHLAEWILASHKQNKQEGLSGARLVLLRFCLHCIGSAQEKLSYDFTSQKSDLEQIGFTKTIGGRVKNWWGFDRLALAHTLAVGEIMCPLDATELAGIVLLLKKLRLVIEKYVPKKDNYLKSLGYNEVDLQSLSATASITAVNIFSTINFAEALSNDKDFADSIAHQILAAICIEVIGTNLASLEDEELISIGKWPRTIIKVRNIIAHANCVGDILEYVDLDENLKLIAQHKNYFKAINEVYSQEKLQLESTDVDDVQYRQKAKKSTFQKETKVMRYAKRQWVSKEWSPEIVPIAAIQLLQERLPGQALKGTHIIDFTIEQVMSALLAEIERLYIFPEDQRDYQKFDIIVKAFKPLIDCHYLFRVKTINGENHVWLHQGWRENKCLPTGYSRSLGIISEGEEGEVEFSHIVYTLGDSNLLKRLFALGFNLQEYIKESDKHLSVIFSFIRTSDTDEKAAYKVKQFLTLCRYYGVHINKYTLSRSAIIAKHAKGTLQHLSGLFNTALNKTCFIKIAGDDKKEATLLGSVLYQGADVLLFPFIMLDLIPALLQHNGPEALRKLILGPKGLEGKYENVIQVLLNCLVARQPTNIMDGVYNTQSYQDFKFQADRIMQNAIFFAIYLKILQSSEQEYKCSKLFFADCYSYMQAMYEEVQQGYCGMALQFLCEKISIDKEMVAGFETSTDINKWDFQLASFAIKYRVCEVGRIAQLKEDIKSLLVNACQQEIKNNHQGYNLHLLAIQENKFQLAEELKKLSDSKVFLIPFPIVGTEEKQADHPNLLKVAQSCCSKEIFNMLQTRYKELVVANINKRLQGPAI